MTPLSLPRCHCLHQSHLSIPTPVDRFYEVGEDPSGGGATETLTYGGADEVAALFEDD